MTTTSIHTFDVKGLGPVPAPVSVSVSVSVSTQGTGPAVLLLHGGAGPQSVGEFASTLAAAGPAHVVVPTHPGFGGTPRPAALSGIPALARTYVALLEALDLTDVTVVGNSVGGWAAAEIGLLGSPRVGRLILVDAVGLDIGVDPIVNFFSLTMDQVADLSYRDPDRFRIDLAALPEAAKAAMAGNRAALLAYGGQAMTDATLAGRLPAIDVDTLVVWGAADRVVRPSHGRAYATAIPGAELVVIDEAGHLPQLETPSRLVDLITARLPRG